MKRAVFLDRDGVLNRVTVKDGKPYPPSREEDLEILPGVPEALASLHREGYLLVVITNQPDVARGSQRKEVVEAINARLLGALPLDAILVCYEDSEECHRRKPNPGMLVEAAQTYGLELRKCYMVGDRWKDVQAGFRAGCTTIFLDMGYQEPEPTPPADYRTDGLLNAAAWILRRGNSQV